ncbi:MAG: Spy/CpxP family protein refolding chaperone [candidate division NC10 bacterium]|nr:Spy/CpxP family protein refolding chaperone [candidate division NC10 bacterium]
MRRYAWRGIWLVALGLAMLARSAAGMGDQPAGAGPAAEPPWPVVNSLSGEEVRGLRDGEGMGLARAAELNGYPGPIHVLEAAREGKIHLEPEQRGAIERIHAAMKAEARALGEQILAREARVEAGFREKRMAEGDLTREVEDIGRQRTALRLAHLRAHLLTASLLRPEQIEHYNQLRGHASQAPDRRHGH